MPTFEYECDDCGTVREVLLFPWELKDCDPLSESYLCECGGTQQSRVCWLGGCWFNGDTPDARIERVRQGLKRQARERKDKVGTWANLKDKERWNKDNKGGQDKRKIISTGTGTK